MVKYSNFKLFNDDQKLQEITKIVSQLNLHTTTPLGSEFVSIAERWSLFCYKHSKLNLKMVVVTCRFKKSKKL